LLALGTHLRSAIRTALSRKGYWHLARRLATQVGMRNVWLKQRHGLISIPEGSGLRLMMIVCSAFVNRRCGPACRVRSVRLNAIEPHGPVQLEELRVD
jgi:hypothetical protein